MTAWDPGRRFAYRSGEAPDADPVRAQRAWESWLSQILA